MPGDPKSVSRDNPHEGGGGGAGWWLGGSDGGVWVVWNPPPLP